MECDNKHILEGSSKGEKLVGGLLLCKWQIKDDSHENIALNMWWT